MTIVRVAKYNSITKISLQRLPSSQSQGFKDNILKSTHGRGGPHLWLATAQADPSEVQKTAVTKFSDRLDGGHCTFQ